MKLRFVFLAVLCSVAAIGAQAPSEKPSGTLAQVMRGIYFPNANLIFDVQSIDPAAPKPVISHGEGASATENFSGIYTGWQVVENAAIALAESTDVIMAAGRVCQNGKPVPTAQADFARFALEMRAAGVAALEAARAQNRAKAIEVTNQLADACANCHERYRDAGDANSPARCTP